MILTIQGSYVGFQPHRLSLDAGVEREQGLQCRVWYDHAAAGEQHAARHLGQRVAHLLLGVGDAGGTQRKLLLERAAGRALLSLDLAQLPFGAREVGLGLLQLAALAGVRSLGGRQLGLERLQSLLQLGKLGGVGRGNVASSGAQRLTTGRFQQGGSA